MSGTSLALPFTSAQFVAVFGEYKVAAWLVLSAAWAFGFLVVFLALVPSRSSSRAIATILAAMWAMTGIVYHGLYFSTLNEAALLAGAAFLIEALIVFLAGWRELLLFGDKHATRAVAGLALILYAIAPYPLLGLAFTSGHRGFPMLGVTPTPVTIFTIGCLLLATRPVPRSILLIPLSWSFIGGIEALLFHIPHDWMLLPSGIAGVALLNEARLVPRPSVHGRGA